MAGNRCDAGCRRPALTWWTRDPDDPDTVPDIDGWQMCGPCAERHGPLLETLGYEMLVDERGEVLATMPTVTEATA